VKKGTPRPHAPNGMRYAGFYAGVPWYWNPQVPQGRYYLVNKEAASELKRRWDKQRAWIIHRGGCHLHGSFSPTFSSVSFARQGLAVRGCSKVCKVVVEA
jgi:hypothetical protein